MASFYFLILWAIFSIILSLFIFYIFSYILDSNNSNDDETNLYQRKLTGIFVLIALTAIMAISTFNVLTNINNTIL